MKSSKIYALISVFDKTGVAPFAGQLLQRGLGIISTGGTARHLREAGVVVQDTEHFTGIGSVLEDRVKTLCPQLHGGLLAVDRMQDEFDRLGYPLIDLVCVNLYPLKQKIAEDASPQTVLESTDMGGVALLRSAAKGRRIIASSPEDYPHILAWLEAGCPREEQFRAMMARKAEATAAAHCIASAEYTSRLYELLHPEFPWEQEIHVGGSKELHQAYWSDPTRVRMG